MIHPRVTTPRSPLNLDTNNSFSFFYPGHSHCVKLAFFPVAHFSQDCNISKPGLVVRHPFFYHSFHSRYTRVQRSEPIVICWPKHSLNQSINQHLQKISHLTFNHPQCPDSTLSTPEPLSGVSKQLSGPPLHCPSRLHQIPLSRRCHRAAHLHRSCPPSTLASTTLQRIRYHIKDILGNGSGRPEVPWSCNRRRREVCSLSSWPPSLSHDRW